MEVHDTVMERPLTIDSGCANIIPTGGPLATCGDVEPIAPPYGFGDICGGKEDVFVWAP